MMYRPASCITLTIFENEDITHLRRTSVEKEALYNCRNISLVLALFLGYTCGIWALKTNMESQ